LLYYDFEVPGRINYLKNKGIFNSIINASGLVFQSNFSKLMYEYFFGQIDIPNIVINNGVSIEKPVPLIHDSYTISQDKVVLFASAKWRGSKRLASLIELFNELNLRYNRLQLVLFGENAVFQSQKNILYLNKIDYKILRSVYNLCDMMIHISFNDACPNTVVEAISVDKPILCTNSGGTKELVIKCKAGIISKCEKDAEFFKIKENIPPVIDMHQLYNDACMMIDDLEKYKAQINKNPIDIKTVAKNYIEYILEVFKLTI